jgi:hypothetical protein
MGEINHQDTPKEKATSSGPARTVNIVNVIALGLMLLMFFSGDSGLLGFVLAIGMGVYNFVSMCVFIGQKNTSAYVSNLIWMLLMPIIGFGCCAVTFKGF